MKPFSRFIIREIIYLLISCVAAAAAALLQFVGSKYEGNYSSFIFSGKEYSYNVFFYLLGAALFIGYIFLSYKLYFKAKLKEAEMPDGGRKAGYIVTAFICSLIMLAALVVILFLVMGLNVNMKPAWMMYLTGFGWPIGMFVYMVVIGVKK